MTTSPLAKFEARIEKSSNKGGWTYVVWPESASFFGTKGLVKIKATIDGSLMVSAFMAIGGGRHKLPLKAELLKTLNKGVGDVVAVSLLERIHSA
jgi:hypothetical protein